MSESSSLSSVVKGITKFNGKAEHFDDWREEIYISISSARGYEHVRKILNGERRPEPVTLQQLHEEQLRQQATRPPAQPQGSTAPTTSQSTDASLSSRTHRSGRTTGGQEPPSSDTTGSQETGTTPPGQEGGGPQASNAEDTSILERLRQGAINEERIKKWDKANAKLYGVIRMTVIGQASVFLHPYRPYPGHESDGIGAWNALVQKYEGDPTQRFYLSEKKLKDLKIKADEDPDIFWQKLLHINAQMEKIGEGLTERRLIDQVIEKLPPAYSIIKFNFVRDPINFSTSKQIQQAMRQTWIRALQPEQQDRRVPTARASGMLTSSKPRCEACGRHGHSVETCWGVGERPPRDRKSKPADKKGGESKKKWCDYHKKASHDTSECHALKKINASKSTNKENKGAAVTANSNSSRQSEDGSTNVTGETRVSNTVTEPQGTTETGDQECTPAGHGFACSASRRDPENDSGINISFRVDSGATQHFCDPTLIPGIEDMMRDVKELHPKMIIDTFGPNPAYGEKSGILQINTRDDKGNWMPLAMTVILTPNTGTHLFSSTRAATRGVYTHFEAESWLSAKGKKITLSKSPDWSKVFLDGTIARKPTNYLTSQVQKQDGTGNHGSACTATSASTWHRRLGHPHSGVLDAVKKIEGAGVTFTGDMEPCETCLVNKSKQLPHPKSTEHNVTQPLQLIYTDIIGPIYPRSLGSYRYVHKFSDQYSKHLAVYYSAYKHETVRVLRDYCHDLAVTNGRRIRRMRTDCGGEYTSEAYREACKELGIRHETSSPFTPQQMGKSERDGGTLMAIARCLLNETKLPRFLWNEIVSTSAYLYNRIPHKTINWETPHRRMFGRDAKLSHLRTIGSSAFVHKEGVTGKTSERAWKGVLVGYDGESPSYRIYRPATRQVIKTRNVRFIEAPTGITSLPPEQPKPCQEPEDNDNSQDANHGSGFLGLWSPEDNLEESINTEDDIPTSRQTSRVTRSQSTRGISSTQRYVGQNAQQQRELNKLAPYLPGASDSEEERNQDPDDEEIAGWDLNTGSAVMATKAEPSPPHTIPIPRNYEEAMRSVYAQEWKEAMAKELNSLTEHKVAENVDDDIPSNNIIGTRWVFAVKSDGRFKARIVAQGFRDKLKLKISEVYSPVCRGEGQRILLSIANEYGWPVHAMDVSTAYLQSNINRDVYIQQPKGFEVINSDTGRPYIWKLKKAVYGLGDSAKRWTDTFRQGLQNLGWKPTLSDPCIFTKGAKEKYALLSVYVDDVMLTSASTDELPKLKEEIKGKFKIKDIGEANAVLGLKISRDMERGLLTISQEAYARRLLERFGMDSCKAVDTPIVESTTEEADNKPLDEEEQLRYQEITGSLIYLAMSTRYDISYSVMALTQSMNRARQNDMKSAKRILRYIKGRPSLGITFRRGYFDLKSYTDASYANPTLNYRSASGYLITLGGGPIAYGARLQRVVALNTCEAELLAMNTAVKHTVYIRGLLNEAGLKQDKPTPVHCDNHSACTLSQTSNFSSRTRHIAVRLAHLKEATERKEISTVFIKGDLQKADVFTKALSRTMLGRAINLIEQDMIFGTQEEKHQG